MTKTEKVRIAAALQLLVRAFDNSRDTRSRKSLITDVIKILEKMK